VEEMIEYYNKIKYYKNKELQLILDNSYYFRRSNKKQLIEECLLREYYKILSNRIKTYIFSFDKEFKHFNNNDIIINPKRDGRILIEIKEKYENTLVWYNIDSNNILAGGIGRSNKIDETDALLSSDEEYYSDFKFIGKYVKDNLYYDWNDLKLLINSI